jgi:hypothetical protein
VNTTSVLSFTDSVTYADGSGNLVTIRLKGGGSGEVQLPAVQTDPAVLVLNDTTTKTEVVISTQRGTETTFSSIVVNGSLKRLTAPSTDLLGDFTISGTIRGLRLDDVRGSDLVINTEGVVAKNGAKLKLSFDQVLDTSIIAAGTNIRSLTATEWIDDDDARDSISAKAIGRSADERERHRRQCGKFHRRSRLNGATGTPLLGKAKIKGAVGASETDGSALWQIGGGIGKIKAGEIESLSLGRNRRHPGDLDWLLDRRNALRRQSRDAKDRWEDLQRQLRGYRSPNGESRHGEFQRRDHRWSMDHRRLGREHQR